MRIPVISRILEQEDPCQLKSDPHRQPPAAPEWYRFALAHPAVNVVLMAPDTRRELEEDLTLIDDWRPPRPEELAALAAHGWRVRRHAGKFP